LADVAETYTFRWAHLQRLKAIVQIYAATGRDRLGPGGDPVDHSEPLTVGHDLLPRTTDRHVERDGERTGIADAEQRLTSSDRRLGNDNLRACARVDTEGFALGAVRQELSELPPAAP
jgi:hypothetical protein